MNKIIRKEGFTLIELIVTIMIVGILTALAVPIFRQNVKRVMATEGHSLIGSIKTVERIYFSEHHKYTSNWWDISGDIDINNNKYFNTAPVINATGTGDDATFSATVTGSGEASGISVFLNNEGLITISGLY
jgi:type IV pilus assembly protein PilE